MSVQYSISSHSGPYNLRVFIRKTVLVLETYIELVKFFRSHKIHSEANTIKMYIVEVTFFSIMKIL